MLRYHAQAVRPGAANARVVRVFQHGQLRLGQARPWLQFTAVEDLSTRSVGFVWDARVRMTRLLSARVIDRYTRGRGELDARVLGVLRVAHTSGSDADRAEATRYLAEIPWAPQAILHNRELVWRSVDPLAVEVSAGATGASVTLHFDASGRITHATATRGRWVGGAVVATPWGGVYSQYAEHAGLSVPTEARVWWELPEGRFEYWRGWVSAVEVS